MADTKQMTGRAWQTYGPRLADICDDSGHIASCEDPVDAERIVHAMNAQADTRAALEEELQRIEDGIGNRKMPRQNLMAFVRNMRAALSKLDQRTDPETDARDASDLGDHAAARAIRNAARAKGGAK